MPIEHPKKPQVRDKLIAVGKEAARQIPGVGVAITALEQIAPDHLQQDQERWQRQITDELNRLATLHRLPIIQHGTLAWELALLASDRSPEGSPDTGITYEEWGARMPDARLSEVEEALADLSEAGWIESWPDANSPAGIGGFHPTALLFAHTDPVTHQRSPHDDAKAVAEFALRQEDAVSAMEIEAELGWEKRRLYPALNYLATVVLPEYATERPWQPNYPFLWLRLDGGVRRILRQFAETGALEHG